MVMWKIPPPPGVQRSRVQEKSIAQAHPGSPCFAEGTTRLVNVPQARMKETDRIAVMKQELDRLGAQVEELEDGLVIHQSDLQGTTVDGHGDHRVVMSLAIAGTMATGDTTIEGAEAAAVTYPGFADALTALGGRVELTE